MLFFVNTYTITPIPIHKIVIPEELQRALNALDELNGKFHSKLNQLHLPKRQVNNRVKISLAVSAAISEYAESVGLLAARLKSNPAKPTLRSMLKGQQSLAYLLQKHGDARILAAEDYRQALEQLHDEEFAPGSGFPSVAKRAKRYDEGNPPDSTEKSNYYRYLVVYRYLSGGALILAWRPR